MPRQGVIHIIRSGAVAHSVQLGEQPLHIGRAPLNDLVLTDPMVSSRHALVWIEKDQFWIRDLGSRNGTFHNDAVVKGVATVAHGDKVRLGPNTELRIEAVSAPVRAGLGWLLEDVKGAVRVPITSDRFTMGSAQKAHLYLPDASPVAATIILHENGEVWIGTDDDEFPVEEDTVFTVAGREYRLIQPAVGVAATIEGERVKYAYSLKCTLNGPAGPEALLEDPNSGLSVRITSANRAVLLFVLARQVLRDREKQTRRDEVGWCDDDDVAVGIWGRNVPTGNSLHVLIHRLRSQVKKAGFDPWFVEKRRGVMRVRLVDVVVDD